jgi:hypothetical protein
MNFEETRKILEIGSFIMTILGVPFAILVYRGEKRKERLAREAETYNAVNDKYNEFLRLCLEHSYINIYDDANANFHRYSKEEQARAVVLFDILVSIFERAFILYKDHHDTIREAQWKGWDAFMNSWMKRHDFRVCWENYLGSQWEVDFTQYMNRLYERNKPVEAVKHLNSALSENIT